nr:MFS transporter [Ensifer sp. WSM1721]
MPNRRRIQSKAGARDWTLQRNLLTPTYGRRHSARRPGRTTLA